MFIHVYFIEVKMKMMYITETSILMSAFSAASARCIFRVFAHLKYVYKMFVHSKCFPDEASFNRHLADVRVLSGLTRAPLLQLTT